MHCIRECEECNGNLFEKANTMMEESTINPLIIINCLQSQTTN